MLTALVTGGTSGIGAAFAAALARDGYGLVLVARNEQRLAETADRLRAEHGVAVETISADLSDRAAVETVVERLESTDRPIDLFVNNAGFGVHKSLLSKDTSVHELAIDVMIRAVLVLGGAAGRTMKARGAGTIINVASVAGYITMGSYSAVKAWVASYSEGLAVELRGTGVQVTGLNPGWVRTEFHERASIGTSSIPSVLWVDMDQLISTALRDARRGRVISTPSAKFKALLFFCRHLPRGAIRAISGRISSARRSESSTVEHSSEQTRG